MFRRRKHHSGSFDPYGDTEDLVSCYKTDRSERVLTKNLMRDFEMDINSSGFRETRVLLMTVFLNVARKFSIVFPVIIPRGKKF